MSSDQKHSPANSPDDVTSFCAYLRETMLQAVSAGRFYKASHEPLLMHSPGTPTINYGRVFSVTVHTEPTYATPKEAKQAPVVPQPQPLEQPKRNEQHTDEVSMRWIVPDRNIIANLVQASVNDAKEWATAQKPAPSLSALWGRLTDVLTDKFTTLLTNEVHE